MTKRRTQLVKELELYLKNIEPFGHKDESALYRLIFASLIELLKGK